MLIKFNSLIIYLLPLALITGPFFSDLIVITSSFIFLFLSIAQVNYKYYLNKFFLFFIIYYFILLITSLNSDNFLFSLESSLFFFRFGLFSLSIWYLIDHNKFFLKYFTYSITFTFIFLIFDGLFQYIFGFNTVGLVYREDRISSFFNDEFVLGSYLSRLFPLLFGLIILNFFQSKKHIFILIIIFILIDVLIYLSGERSAFAYLILSSFMMLILLRYFKYVRIFALFLSILLIIGMSLINPSLKDRMITSTFKDMNIFSNKDIYRDYDNLPTSIYFFSIQHDAIYKSAFKMFKSNLLTGIGPKMFRIKCNEKNYFVEYNSDLHSNIKVNGCSTHPHSLYMQLLAETGLIGFLPVFILFLYICYKLIIHVKNSYINNKYIYNDYQILLLICFILTLFPISPSGNIFHNWTSIIYFLPVGFFLHEYYKNKK